LKIRTAARNCSYLPAGNLSPQFVEEVFEEDHVALRLLHFGQLGWHKYDDTFAVRGEIVVRLVEESVA
jgi:hypothetical protein